MRVVVGDTEAFDAHEVDATHPERPARSKAAREGAARLGDRIGRYPVVPATRAQVERIHHPLYVEAIAATEGAPEPVVFDEDTAAYGGTYRAALLSAGAAVGGVDAVFALADAPEATRAFALGRPPGHHAEVDRAMGYCFFNSVAIAAQHSIDAHGCKRVAIVDWDVHHGNGTQRSFEMRRDVLFVSSHQHKLFPPTGGFYKETGRGAGKGFTVNLPLPYEATDAQLLRLHQAITAPVLEDFAPDLILVSAGFDAHADDRTADQRITARGFGRLAALLCGVADRVCAGRTVFVLEGGYDRAALADSIAAVLEAALDPASFAEELPPPGATEAAIVAQLVELHGPAWPRVRGLRSSTAPAG